MKVHVTKEELLVLVSRALGEKVEEIVISKPSVRLYDKLIAHFKQAGCLTSLNGIAPDKKIAAIKLLRDIAPHGPQGKMGLADAKNSIDNWDEFMGFIRSKGRFPKNDPQFDGNRYVPNFR